MKCLQCGESYNAKSKKATLCQSCGSVNMMVLVSQDYINYCRKIQRAPQEFAKFLIAKGWIQEKEQAEYLEQKAREDLAQEGF